MCCTITVIHDSSPPFLSLGLTRFSDDWILVVGDLARATATSLNGLDDIHRFVICDLTEDYVLAIKPSSHNCRDEKLGAIPMG